MSTKLTMSAREITEHITANASGVTAVDMKAIQTYLDKLEYRQNYNKRPDVIQARKARNAAKAAEQKATGELIKRLLAERLREQNDAE